LNSDLTALLIPEKGQTIQSWIEERYRVESAKLTVEFEKVSGAIHISFDLWTSTSSITLLGIVAHYLDQSGKDKRKLIGLPRVQGSHGGENLAPLMLATFQKFGIERRIGCF